MSWNGADEAFHVILYHLMVYFIREGGELIIKLKNIINISECEIEDFVFDKFGKKE